MADSRKSYNEHKLKLTVAKGQLTKSLNNFEDSCKGLVKDLAKNNLPATSKVPMAALVINKLSILSEKKEEIRRCREKWDSRV